MRARHLHLPGLHTGLLASGRLPVLQEFPPTGLARMALSFGRSVAILDTTLRTGMPPSRHGVLFAGEPSQEPDRLTDTHFLHDASTPDEIDAALSNAIDHLADGQLLLVSGGPVHAAAPGLVEIDAGGLALRCDRDFALAPCDPQNAELDPALRDRWLRTPGVARILAPTTESAGGWMAPIDRGWLILPEPGWRMAGDGAGTPGHAVLLAFGPAWTIPWPDAVHDWRVTPTLLAANGNDHMPTYDRPLPGLPALQG